MDKEFALSYSDICTLQMLLNRKDDFIDDRFISEVTELVSRAVLSKTISRDDVNRLIELVELNCFSSDDLLDDNTDYTVDSIDNRIMESDNICRIRLRQLNQRLIQWTFLQTEVFERKNDNKKHKGMYLEVNN